MSDLTLHRPPAARPYRIDILSGSKRGTWGHYSIAEAALAIASSLRKHGFDCRVVDTRTNDLLDTPAPQESPS